MNINLRYVRWVMNKEKAIPHRCAHMFSFNFMVVGGLLGSSTDNLAGHRFGKSIFEYLFNSCLVDSSIVHSGFSQITDRTTAKLILTLLYSQVCTSDKALHFSSMDSIRSTC